LTRYARRFDSIESEVGLGVADETREQVTANEPPRAQHRRRRWWQRTWFKVLVVVVIVGVTACIVAAEYVIRHAEPMIRARLVDTLSAYFHAPVQLDHLDISLIKGVELAATGVEVDGNGLRVGYPPQAGQSPTDDNAPMVSIQHFEFHTRIRNLLRRPTRVIEVDVQGMEVHIPPSSARAAMLGAKGGGPQPKISFLVDQIRCKDVKLLIDTNKPGKEPLEFDIQRVDLHEVTPTKPFIYQAELTNPVPVGEVHAEGHFGPWNAADPRETALDGSYSFSHADLGTIKGIHGMLSSHGQFAGVLDHITIDGETSTPDFALDVSDHPMPLHTVFHAYVDGTDGDTYLDPVQARLQQSDFTASGKVVGVKGKGHDIDMNVIIPHGRIQDFLEVGVKTKPTLMNGVVTMKGHLEIPPGQERVPQKMQLAGSFQLRNVQFNNPSIQDKVDGLSARAQGKPQEVAQYSTDKQAEVTSTMSANFSLQHGLMNVHDLHYQIPGALVLLNGVYSTDGNVFEFTGHVRTQATASQMVTGWKSWLLKPVDPFLKKNGAGLELPISISGSQGDVHFGLAMHGKADESNQQMATDLRTKRPVFLADAEAKRACDAAVQSLPKDNTGAGGKSTKEQRKAEKDCIKAQQKADAARAAQEVGPPANKPSRTVDTQPQNPPAGPPQ
jgi:hypothetical protein